MALVKGTNSYLTVEEANAYFADRLDVSAWTAASDAMKGQALVTASSMMNDHHWTDTAISDSQTLAFPRNGKYFEPRLGYETDLSSTVPKRILDATCEMAHHLLNNEGLLDDSGELNSLSVGTISLDFKTSADLIPPVVSRQIKPLLANGGANVWWRAN